MILERFLMRGGLAAGLILSVASALNFCAVDACSEAHKYTLLGIAMPFLGIGFFIIAGILYELSIANTFVKPLFLLLMFCASGAEVAFLLIQKFRIQKWCPLCLGVAATVYFVTLVTSFEGVKNMIARVNLRGIMIMPLMRKIVTIVLVFTAGFFLAYRGMEKGDAEESVPKIFLGKQDSSVEVFIMTDWFCPACQKAEQEIERTVPALEKRAKVFFVDIAIHPETLNYTPYNLSFLTYEKSKYMELRKALLGLTKKTKEPTPDDVKGAITPLNVVYKPLSFLEATRGIKFYEAVSREFKVSATPTVVVRDTKTGKVARLVGIKEINETNMIKAVDQITQ
jgi:hypothetical protein